MNALTAHIVALNLATKAWVAVDPTNRWAGLLVEDLGHWAEHGVHTVAEFNRYLDECAYSDGYKEVYGVRPGYISRMSDAELASALDSLSAVAKDEAKREEFYASLDAENARLDAMENPAPLPYEEWDV